MRRKFEPRDLGCYEARNAPARQPRAAESASFVNVRPRLADMAVRAPRGGRAGEQRGDFLEALPHLAKEAF